MRHANHGRAAAFWIAALATGCDHGWSYHLPAGQALVELQAEPGHHTYHLAAGAVDYQLACDFFVMGLVVASEVRNTGTTPLTFHVRQVELLDAAGHAIPMDAVFENAEAKTGFYAEPNRGQEFWTGVKIIAPGQTYRIGHRFGKVSGLEGGFGGMGSHVNPQIRTVTFVNSGLEANGKSIPIKVTFESDFVR